MGHVDLVGFPQRQGLPLLEQPPHPAFPIAGEEVRVSHRGGLGHELALYSEGSGEPVEDSQLGSGSVTSVLGRIVVLGP